MNYNLPQTDTYVEALTVRWQSYGNVVSEALEDQWTECCTTYNTAASTQDNIIRVLPCVTGSAKTLGACVYAAMFIRQEVQEGILVVTRTIEQANTFVREVRSMLLPKYQHLVDADHSQGRAPTQPKTPLNDERLSTEEVNGTQVLVITHAAFFERILKGTQELPFSETPRRLTIIDEALNGLVTEAHVTVKKVDQVLYYFDDDLADRYPAQYSGLLRVKNLLAQQMEDEKRARVRNQFDPEDEDHKEITKTRLLARTEGEGLVAFREFIDMQPLLNAMRRIEFDKKWNGEKNEDARRATWKKVRRTLESCEMLIRLFVYIHKSGSEFSLNSAQLILNQNLKGVVCLDATAHLNPTWKLLGDRVAINKRISRDVRNYSNVELWVTEAYAVGKNEMTKRIKSRGAKLRGSFVRT